jgi:hypothetical protein
MITVTGSGSWTIVADVERPRRWQPQPQCVVTQYLRHTPLRSCLAMRCKIFDQDVRHGQGYDIAQMDALSQISTGVPIRC